jgi:hypothetical protein
MFRKFIRKLLKFLSKREIKQRQFAIGINSFIDKEKDRHMLFLDYDTNNLNEVLDDCNELSNFFNLSDFEVYRTSNGFHTFFWYDNSLPYSRVRMIINYSRCDIMFKYISKLYDHKTVRVSGKYKVRDIFYCGKFSGHRTPTNDERELGELKKQEYLSLKKLKLFQDDVLK